jgi:hypothetical protein
VLGRKSFGRSADHDRVPFARVEELGQRLRARTLAGDQRAGRWARAKARRAQYEYVRASWRTLSLVVVGALAFPLGMLPLVPGGFARGLLVGTSTTAVAGMVSFWVVQATGTAPTMMGDQGEQWTAQQLRRMRRQGWRVVNHVTLRQWDIDHVLLGPGGVYAIETKWSATPWKTCPPERRVAEACEQVAANSRDLTLLLKRHGVGAVEPVVVLWGAGTKDLPAVQPVTNGPRTVLLVSGPSAASWLTTLPTDRLQPDQVLAAWQALDKQCQIRDPAEAAAAPLPMSVSAIATRGFIAVAVASIAFLVAASLLARSLSPLWWLPTLGVLVLPGAAVLHWANRGRYVAHAWLGGLMLSVLLIGWALAKWLMMRTQ